MSAGVLFRFALLLLLGKRTLAEIRYSVAEEVKDGTVVGNLAKDLGLDVGSLADRRFRVVSESKEAFFEANPHNGVLHVNRRIDRDDSCQGSGVCLFELKVIVENPLEIHYVVVEITDVNDHAPVFTEKEQTFEIAEHTSPGKRFKLHAAHDPDAGMNSIRAYTLTSNEHFEVDVRQSDEEKIPFLLLKKSLDREEKEKHSLLVTAVDGGKPPRSGTLNVSIVVLDSNDNRPTFSQDTYQITIAENIPIGTSIFRLNGTDPDEGVNGEIDYSFAKTLKKNIDSIFEVDKTKGVITVKGDIDYEENDIFKLDIEASDRGTPPLTGECRIIIKIKDVNDNVPEIEVTSLSNIVAEDSKPGTVISLISVKDKDPCVNGKIICTMTNDVPFELKPSYRENIFSVATKEYLDREQVSHYEIEIKATDCGRPPLSTLKSLNIQISDVNDNSPHFEKNPLEFYLTENNVAGSSIFSVSATDKDINDNAMISYQIVRGGGPNDITSFLNINSETGEVTALKSLDFEALKSFQFQVSATDGGSPPLSGNVTVKVFILDQNDNAPVIVYPLSSNGSAQGAEEIPRNSKAGDLVTRVRAYDADTGYNGWLLFSLHPPGERALFSLDRYTGQIRTLRSFTETDGAEHRLLVLVKDNGDVSLSATATVTVKLAEPKEAFAASDHVQSAAEADRSEDRLTFYLALTLGSVSLLLVISVVVLIAMRCSKSTEYTSKYLQDAHYDGTLCHSIQYRSGDKRYMLVGPRMSIGSTIVPGSRANTLLMSDAAGEVRQLYFFMFSFYSASVLHCKEEHDRSGDKSRRYSVPSGDAVLNYYSKGAQGGRRLNMYRTRPVIFPLLLCYCELISAQLKYSTPEEVKVGSIVGNVAKDLGLDAATLTSRRFRMVSGAQDTLFEVNPNNGLLLVHKHLDREHMCDRNAVCAVDLKVVVENPLEIHYVSVEVTDVNDHAPTFAERGKIIEIAESTLSGARFQLPGARDPDVGINSIQRYKLSQNEHFRLEIRERDDDKIPFLLLQKQLDREQKINHSLILSAIDGGTPSKSANLNVTIRVLDINDNRPVFSKEGYSAELQENAALGTSVIKVQATDLDEGANGEVEYEFGGDTNAELMRLFSLDKKLGVIRVEGQIDFESTHAVKLDVQASDKGQPPMTTDCRVIIKIQDVNDNQPEIEVTSIASTVAEDAKHGTVIALISVSDADSGPNGKVVCSLTPNGPLQLKPSFKENMFSLVTKDTLDRETTSSYDISITATDCGQPPLATFKTVNIQVKDVNDNVPEFPQNPFHFYLTENNKPGAPVFSVNAVDKDAGSNAAVSYSIVRQGGPNDITSFLNINSETGEVTALKSLDFEALKSFQFQVSATDGGSPPLSGNVTVKVFILDQNDNAPVIVYPLSSNGSAQGAEEIPRNSKAGDLVTRVRAYDADTGYNGWLLFSLHPPGERALFSLDRYTGQIRTLRSFTETDGAEHRLLVLVKDNGDVSLSATATVTVKLAEPKEAFAASDHVQSAAEADRSEDRLTFYLALTLGSVSLLLVISVVVLIAMRCSKSTEYTSKYLQDAHYDGTLCHSIQYRSGDKRYMLVGPRMSIGSTVVPGSRANTLLMSDAAGEVRKKMNLYDYLRCFSYVLE
ncbi:protocadherin gamma-A4-like [Syngnathoides biaculeatus]|uniref:protocadherin gamma-A4-like n=1 Tax=Syngnathoides biaculeatus TaxID=300417 RepID=UPI002ADD9CC0|nr:protocadherin gamma-A4-like [Syngnathoides biaculeatus]